MKAVATVTWAAWGCFRVPTPFVIKTRVATGFELSNSVPDSGFEKLPLFIV